MRENYKIMKPTDPFQFEIEKEVIEVLHAMESHTKLSVSEIANTALKRFISAHKDFLPPDHFRKKSLEKIDPSTRSKISG